MTERAQRRSTGVRAIVVAGLAALAAGCGGDDGAGGGGFSDGRAVAFSDGRAVGDGRTVRLAVGGSPCELPVRGAEVEEGDDSVRIALRGQRVGEDEACIALLATDCVEVRLDRPLGGRRLIDATGRPDVLGRPGAERLLRRRCRAIPRD